MNLVAQNNRNLFSHCSGGHSLKLRCPQGCASSRGSKRESVPCPSKLLMTGSTPWLADSHFIFCLHLYMALSFALFLLFCLCKDRSLVLRPTGIIQDDPILRALLYKNFFSNKFIFTSSRGYVLDIFS